MVKLTLDLVISDGQFDWEQFFQFDRTDPLHLRIGRSSRPVLTNADKRSSLFGLRSYRALVFSFQEQRVISLDN